jgi:GNAT superfamily N-acetyltransferase
VLPQGRTIAIERLSALPPGFPELVCQGEREGWRFLRRLAEEWESNANRFEGPGEALFAARLAKELAGVCGLNADPYAGSERVGRLRHLYVHPACRRLGVGRGLVEQVVLQARGRFERLRLRTANPEAARLYERLGFEPYGEDATCTHVMVLG